MTGNSTYLHRLWELLTGPLTPDMPAEFPLITSLLYYSCTLILGRVGRHVVRNAAPERFHPYLLDMVTAFQLMGCSLENGQIRKHYGDTAYIIVMVTLAIWYAQTIHGSHANPCAHVIHYMRGRYTGMTSLARVVCQLIGGFSSYYYARMFWSFELTASHRHRYHSVHCTTDLTIPAPLGFLIEFSGSMIEVCLSLTAFSSFRNCEMTLRCFFSAFLTILGVDFTGMYLNPINASNQTFGCRGLSHMEHVFVYWVSTLTAAAIAVTIHPHITSAVKNAVCALRLDFKTLNIKDGEKNDSCDKEGRYVNKHLNGPMKNGRLGLVKGDLTNESAENEFGGKITRRKTRSKYY